MIHIKLINGIIKKKMNNFIFYGQFDPPIDKVIYERYFKYRQKPGVFIECGAGDGLGNTACYFFERFLTWTGINIEASKYSYSLLAKNRPHSLANLNCGLGSEDNILLFKDVISAPGGGHGNSSFQHTPEHAKELENYECKFDIYPVEVKTLDRITSMYKIHPDLIVLDVEGYELEVIKGMNINLPLVLCAEYYYCGLDNLKELLYPKGYTLDLVLHSDAYFTLEED